MRGSLAARTAMLQSASSLNSMCSELKLECAVAGGKLLEFSREPPAASNPMPRFLPRLENQAWCRVSRTRDAAISQRCARLLADAVSEVIGKVVADLLDDEVASGCKIPKCG